MGAGWRQHRPVQPRSPGSARYSRRRAGDVPLLVERWSPTPGPSSRDGGTARTGGHDEWWPSQSGAARVPGANFVARWLLGAATRGPPPPPGGDPRIDRVALSLRFGPAVLASDDHSERAIHGFAATPWSPVGYMERTVVSTVAGPAWFAQRIDGGRYQLLTADLLLVRQCGSPRAVKAGYRTGLASRPPAWEPSLANVRPRSGAGRATPRQMWRMLAAPPLSRSVQSCRPGWSCGDGGAASFRWLARWSSCAPIRRCRSPTSIARARVRRRMHCFGSHDIAAAALIRARARARMLPRAGYSSL